MSLLDTDERVTQSRAYLDGRPRLDLRTFNRDVLDLLRNVPLVRLSAGRDRMEEKRLELARKRSRLAYIKVMCLRELGELGGYRKELENWCYAKYPDLIKRAGNDRQRAALVGTALAPFDRRIDPIRTLVDLVDVALHDYDSRAFGFRDVVAGAKVGDRGE